MIARKLAPFFTGIAGSYTQIFFSTEYRLAPLLILATFVDPYTGLSGLAAVVIALFLARWLKLNPALIADGTYSYNSLLVGLAIGLYFKMNAAFFLILALASTFTLFLSVLLCAEFARCRLPFLSVPFLMGTWAVLLSTRSYSTIGLSERGVYAINELWSFGGEGMVRLYEQVSQLSLAPVVSVYLKSLGAILFQYNELSGLLVAIWLLVFSRIAFSLALLGFFTGLAFYYLLEGNFVALNYSYIGFNFILSAIALGGYYVVPSRRSYMLVFLTTPLIGLLMSACGRLLWTYQLPLYSLPFNLIALLTLYVLAQRSQLGKAAQPELVQLQQFCPEKNFYRHHYQKQRLCSDSYFQVHLPFFGQWYISQGHDGSETHVGDWRYGWDFVVADEMHKTARAPATNPSHFFSYNLPVLAPAAGQVIEIIDEVEDNEIGQVSLAQNWGNTIVLKHADYLYSKISHLRAGSFRVKAGDYVRKGEFIGSCGNSGRSAEPHIHFQLQSTPFVGSRTMKYPIAYYVVSENGRTSLRTFSYPQQGETVARIAVTPLLREALNFVPGEILSFDVKTAESREPERVSWEVLVDGYNQPYLCCRNTGALAYFNNNESVHYFTDFVGDRRSLLHYFFMGAHTILLGYYQDLQLNDRLPIEGLYSGWLKFVQDFAAPFHMFLETPFCAVCAEIDNPDSPASITISTQASASVKRQVKRKVDFLIVFNQHGLQEFRVDEGGKVIIARRSLKN